MLGGWRGGLIYGGGICNISIIAKKQNLRERKIFIFAESVIDSIKHFLGMMCSEPNNHLLCIDLIKMYERFYIEIAEVFQHGLAAVTFDDGKFFVSIFCRYTEGVMLGLIAVDRYGCWRIRSHLAFMLFQNFSKSSFAHILMRLVHFSNKDFVYGTTSRTYCQ